MVISQNSKRIVGTVTNNEYEEIEKLAEIESRTVSNMVTKLVREALENRKKGK